jgi:hypothetical protein
VHRLENLFGDVLGLDESDQAELGLALRADSYVGNVIGYPSNYLQKPVIGFAYPATFGPEPESSTWFNEWNGLQAPRILKPGEGGSVGHGQFES